MYRVDFINQIIKENHYKSILCIGVGYGKWFLYIKCPRIYVIDVYKEIPWRYRKDTILKKINRRLFKHYTEVYQGSVSDFYQKYGEMLGEKKIDVVFIDGIHKSQEVFNEINKALSIISENGVVFVNNVLPRTEIQKYAYSNYYEMLENQPDDFDGVWCGEVYDAVEKIKKSNKNLNARTYAVANGIVEFKK